MPQSVALTREEFIENNMGLVHSCAHRFKNRGIEYDDLFQAGAMGLIKAYDGFDAERGLMFSTYAVPVILGEIKKLFRDAGTVKVSRRLKEISMKASRISEELLKQTGEEPPLSEIARILECPEDLLVEAMCSAKPYFSLTSDDDEDSREFDIPVVSDEERVVEKLTLQEAIRRLETVEQNIVTERFFRSRTQAQTAKNLGTTQVQISRKEHKILQKLRNLMGD